MSSDSKKDESRDCDGPWGLPVSVLAPGKVITDPVHRDIHLSTLEIAVVDSRPFQRLRRIRQLGNTHLVYPGAVHSRFSHSLGALSVAEKLLKIVRHQGNQLHGVREDLFAEWVMGAGDEADKKWKEARVLARLGALLHDLCHLPAGHTVEDDLGILEPHDAVPATGGLGVDLDPEATVSLGNQKPLGAPGRHFHGDDRYVDSKARANAIEVESRAGAKAPGAPGLARNFGHRGERGNTVEAKARCCHGPTR